MTKIRTAFNLIALFFMANLCSALLDEEGKPSPALQQLLILLEVPNDGSLKSIVSATQNRWIQTGKERWEFEERYPEKREESLACLREIGCLDAVEPQKTHYKGAVVLGALTKRMELRINTLIDAWKKGVHFEKVYLLAGVRPLDPKVEPTLPKVRTEAEMMRHLYLSMKSDMPPALAALPVGLIATKMQQKEDGTLRRPNTLDTIRSWLETSPEAGHYLFISNQPFVGYQESVIRSILPPEFSIETIGVRADSLPLSVYLDSLARWLYQEQLRRNQ